MAVGRKGFVFTTLAVLLIAIIVLLASAEDSIYPRTRAQTARIESMNTYLTNLQYDLPSAAYIAGFRSLIGMEEHISLTGAYVTDFNSDFASMFTNGTVNGTYYAIMDDSTFMSFADRFATLAGQQGMVAQLTVQSVDAYHESPWLVTLNVTVGVVLSDRTNTAVFNRTESVLTQIPIDSVKDPLYTVGTQGRAPHPVVQSNVTTPYITAGNNTDRLQELINNTYYIESATAPSFIQRFSGNFTPSPYGIQSLVHIAELQAQDLTIETCRSIVDHLYFQEGSTEPNYYIVNTDNDEVWLDDAHLAVYDADGKTTGVRPCP